MSSTPKSRAEKELLEAIETLQNALPKDARTYLGQISFPRFEDPSAVEDNAAELEVAIDKLISARDGITLNPNGVARVKDVVRKWYRASYPFANLFLGIAKDAVVHSFLKNP
jgi:hypothetical protein